MAHYFKLLRSSCYAMASFFISALLPYGPTFNEGLGAFGRKKKRNIRMWKLEKESVGKTCGSALDKVIGEKGPVFLAQAAEDAASQAETLNKKMKRRY